MAVKTPLAEVEPADVFSQLVRREPTLSELIDAIGKAKRDARVKSLVFTPFNGRRLVGAVAGHSRRPWPISRRRANP
jgi:hypothetical protein